jgi:hypothetical protein
MSDVLGMPVPRQEFVNALSGVIGQASEDVGKPRLRIDVVELGGLCRLPNYAEWFWEEPVICAYLRVVERSSSQFHSA